MSGEHYKEEIKKAIKKKIKDQIKKELKQELLDEIYRELLLEEEELSQEVSKTLAKRKKIKAISEKTKGAVTKIEKDVPPAEKPEVEITVKAVLKIASHSLKYANKKIPREDWVEVIGLLAGKKDGTQALTIEDAYPMGHGTAVYAEIKDYKNFVRAFNDIKKKGLFICGWYHSHPSYGCFMSDEDIGTQERYQKLWGDAVALVIDPYEIDGTSYGFQIFKANLKTRKWFPLYYQIKGKLSVKTLPELVKFINPIIDGKAIYLEYDE